MPSAAWHHFSQWAISSGNSVIKFLVQEHLQIIYGHLDVFKNHSLGSLPSTFIVTSQVPSKTSACRGWLPLAAARLCAEQHLFQLVTSTLVCWEVQLAATLASIFVNWRVFCSTSSKFSGNPYVLRLQNLTLQHLMWEKGRKYSWWVLLLIISVWWEVSVVLPLCA